LEEPGKIRLAGKAELGLGKQGFTIFIGLDSPSHWTGWLVGRAYWQRLLGQEGEINFLGCLVDFLGLSFN